MIGLGRRQLTSLLSEVSLSTWVELISLMEGLRTAVIISVPSQDVSRWVEASAESQLVCLESSYELLQIGVAAGNHMLVRTSRGKGSHQDVILAKSIEAARAVANMTDDEERGRALGYPDCCIKAYVDRSGQAEWLDSVIDSAPTDTTLPVACNRVSAIIDGRSFVPDYFPCSLTCQATQQLGNNIIRMLKRLGFGQVVDIAVTHLLRTIIVTPEFCIRLPRQESNENADFLARLPPFTGSVNQVEISGNMIFASRRDDSGLPSSSYQILRILNFAPPLMEF